MTVSGDSGFVHAGPYGRCTGLTNTSLFRSKEGTRITREIPHSDAQDMLRHSHHYQGFVWICDKRLFPTVSVEATPPRISILFGEALSSSIIQQRPQQFAVFNLPYNRRLGKLLQLCEAHSSTWWGSQTVVCSRHLSWKQALIAKDERQFCRHVLILQAGIASLTDIVCCIQYHLWFALVFCFVLWVPLYLNYIHIFSMRETSPLRPLIASLQASLMHCKT